MKIENINVEKHEVLVTPNELKETLPATSDVAQFVTQSRKTVQDIVAGQDPRMLVVVGPCSIHDPEAAIEYAQKLRALMPDVEDQLFCVMRAYFEKPRSTVGWKGLINDPHLNDTFCISEGLHMARSLLLDLSEMGLPLATEALDPISPQYLQDLISWSAIGARTTESQTHREMASGLSCAVGFKNGTDGSLDVAVNAMESAVSPHRFLGISPNGRVSVIETRGNEAVHVVLRGGSNGPNYSTSDLEAAEAAMEKIGRRPSIMVDCSHANSSKDHRRQALVLDSVGNERATGRTSLTGVMIESHLVEGRQNSQPGQPLTYGQSITDACVGWDETRDMLTGLATRLRNADTLLRSA